MPDIINNKRLSRFEINYEDGKIAYLEYRWKKADMLLMRTYVPPEHRSKGAASSLTKAALEHAATNNLKVRVFCPFVELFIRKHEEYKGLLAALT